MLTKRSGTLAVTIKKNLVSDQTYTHVHEKLNTTNLAFSASRGFGAADGTSTAWFFGMGGFDDQLCEGVFRFVSPTVAASCSIGPLVRVQTLDTNPSYYWARVDAGVARITRVVSGSFTTLASSAYALPVETDVRIRFTVRGNVLSASFDSGGSPATVNLAATDTLIAGGGLLGGRSLTSTVYCSEMTGSQLL